MTYATVDPGSISDPDTLYGKTCEVSYRRQRTRISESSSKKSSALSPPIPLFLDLWGGGTVGQIRLYHGKGLFRVLAAV